MSKLLQNDTFSWYLSLDDAREDGYAPVKCPSPLCFFRLQGKKTAMLAENLEVIPAMTYLYLAEDKYYLKEYRGWDLDTMYFYKRTLTFSGEDEAVEILRQRIKLGEVWLLFTKEMAADFSAMLNRVYNAYWKSDSKLQYRIWLELLDESLRLQEFQRNNSKTMTGFKTVCKLREDKISELWKIAKERQK
jgi:hypothetical protein